MADIELVIKIPEGLKNDFILEQWTALSCMEMKNALEKATPLPKGHGDLMDKQDLIANSPNYDFPHNGEMGCYIRIKDILHAKPIIEAESEDK